LLKLPEIPLIPIGVLRTNAPATLASKNIPVVVPAPETTPPVYPIKAPFLTGPTVSVFAPALKL